MNAKSKTPKSPRTVKAGSVTVKIYYSHSYKYSTFTVTWRIGLQRHRKTFSNKEHAISFAQETAENLSKGHVAATTVTVAEAACKGQSNSAAGAGRKVKHLLGS